ncbi:MAG TPA: hypothetical protein VJR58_20820 [Vineibacter sp.]|nr:hypothetical protein [Vineibacter sp.]
MPAVVSHPDATTPAADRFQFMSPSLTPEELADRVRERYTDRSHDDLDLRGSAIADAAAISQALSRVRLAKSALKDLARAGNLSITMELGANNSEEMISLDIAEEGLQRTLEALKRL